MFEQDCVEEMIVETQNHNVDFHQSYSHGPAVEPFSVPVREDDDCTKASPFRDTLTTSTGKSYHGELGLTTEKNAEDQLEMSHENKRAGVETEQYVPQHRSSGAFSMSVINTAVGNNFISAPVAAQDPPNIPRLENFAFITFDGAGRMLLISAQNIAEMFGATVISQFPEVPNAAHQLLGATESLAWAPPAGPTFAAAAPVSNHSADIENALTASALVQVPLSISAPIFMAAENRPQLKQASVGSLPTAVVNPIKREATFGLPQNLAPAAKRYLPPFESFIPTFRTEMSSTVVKPPKQESVGVDGQPLVWLNAAGSGEGGNGRNHNFGNEAVST